MLVQEFVRGMGGLDRRAVDTTFANGLMCQAMRRDPALSWWQAEALLSDGNLERHRHQHSSFGPRSPYISTSAGTYLEGSDRTKFNQPVHAVDTALTFAVLLERTDGWLFYGYHFLLGRPAGRHAEFAEEIRDVHQHPQWSAYRDEGEVAAALRIPPRRLRLAEFYRYDDVMAAVAADAPMTPQDRVVNPAYESPETVMRARGLV